MRRLILFGRRPRAGRVKTRLAPLVGSGPAERLYRAFLCDQLTFLRGFESFARVAWWTDGPLDPALDAGLPVEGLELRLQGRGDLGRRLARAFSTAAREGSAATVIVGADSPTLPASRVREAFRRLARGADAVLGPAEDGGYVLIGARGSRPELFRDVPWGGPAVAETTRRRAAAAGIALEETAPWYDVDDGPGLRRLARELRRARGAARAPETARALLDSAFRIVV